MKINKIYKTDTKHSFFVFGFNFILLQLLFFFLTSMEYFIKKKTRMFFSPDISTIIYLTVQYKHGRDTLSLYSYQL